MTYWPTFTPPRGFIRIIAWAPNERGFNWPHHVCDVESDEQVEQAFGEYSTVAAFNSCGRKVRSKRHGVEFGSIGTVATSVTKIAGLDETGEQKRQRAMQKRKSRK